MHELTTADGAKISGVLRVVPGARTVVALMHPRQDLAHHVLVPELLARGFAVWTQGTRSVNNDISLVHEQALLDAAAGQVFLRERGVSSTSSPWGIPEAARCSRSTTSRPDYRRGSG